jgi:hypothetical protein
MEYGGVNVQRPFPQKTTEPEPAPMHRPPRHQIPTLLNLKIDSTGSRYFQALNNSRAPVFQDSLDAEAIGKLRLAVMTGQPILHCA